MFDVLPAFYLDRDVPQPDTMTREGWRYAESTHTGFRYFVRSKQNRRWLATWGVCVTDFEVREVDTVVDGDGVIWAALGNPAGVRLYGNADSIAESGLF
jgi:hypothetical protein